jgi:hypothetical protein
MTGPKPPADLVRGLVGPQGTIVINLVLAEFADLDAGHEFQRRRRTVENALNEQDPAIDRFAENLEPQDLEPFPPRDLNCAGKCLAHRPTPDRTITFSCSSWSIEHQVGISGF